MTGIVVEKVLISAENVELKNLKNYMDTLVSKYKVPAGLDYDLNSKAILAAKEHIFDPLGMKNTFLVCRRKKTNHLSERQLEDFHISRPGYGYGSGVRTHMDKIQSGCLSPFGEFGRNEAAGSFAMVDTDNKISLTYFQHIHNWNIRIQTEMRNALCSGFKCIK